MAAPKVEQITTPIIIGEGPHWYHKAQALYYVDVFGPGVIKYSPATKKQTSVKLEGTQISFVIPLEGATDKFVVAVGRNVAIMTWDGESSSPSDMKIVCTVDNDGTKDKNNLNDGKADPTGRLWAGSLGPESKKEGEICLPEAGSLFSFDKNWKATTHATRLTVANGLAWSEDLKHMYYIDSPTQRVDVFDFDAKNGKVSNRRTAFDFVKNGVEGFPDGMTIDMEGKLWVACFGGSQVIRIDPNTGKLLSKVPIPALQVTSVTFGGPQLDELYVTTAKIKLSDDELKKNPGSGATFRVTELGVKGCPGQNVIA